MKISVIVPAYNSARFIRETIASATAQSRAPDEIIVVDDASTDGTSEAARESGATVLSLSSNRGRAGACNAGAEIAAGDAYAFLDSDDLWATDTLEALETCLLENPESAAASCTVVHLFGDLEGVHRCAVPTGANLDLHAALAYTNVLPASATLVRRESFHAVGGYDPQRFPRLTEDYDLWLRLSEKHRFATTDRGALHYRVHPGQISKNPIPMLVSGWKARADILTWSSRAQDPEVRGAIQRAFLHACTDAWRRADDEALVQLLAVGPRLGDLGQLPLHWRIAVTLPTSIPSVLRSAYSALPTPVRDSVRRLWMSERASVDP